MKRSISEQNKTQKTLQTCLTYSICFTYSMNGVLKGRTFFLCYLRVSWHV